MIAHVRNPAVPRVFSRGRVPAGTLPRTKISFPGADFPLRILCRCITLKLKGKIGWGAGR
ncbi:MAG: hypothetical protein C6W56_07175 [Caldibacillus debilis]|nr:MAG: hypothetical protein C6W56_07175 [Caldibacillus debilis]